MKNSSKINAQIYYIYVQNRAQYYLSHQYIVSQASHLNSHSCTMPHLSVLTEYALIALVFITLRYSEIF